MVIHVPITSAKEGRQSEDVSCWSAFHIQFGRLQPLRLHLLFEWNCAVSSNSIAAAIISFSEGGVPPSPVVDSTQTLQGFLASEPRHLGATELKVEIPRGTALPHVPDLALTGPMAVMDAEGLSEPTTEASETVTAVIHAVGEMEARLTRQRHPTVTLFIVEALTLARDGGILDWDDRVCDVLDDRELVSCETVICPHLSLLECLEGDLDLAKVM
ncbi:unnamed protein product [Hydatigera taeniaeformis]|uniref:Par3_HAL_N_term domain-containing protein n=1 Tax=Hydatigena taeniaeformis TaxID=6205 RepID=A0A0R3X937_HYDTA|nr:unnamed protein product [Hydatigera taeniaeformis]